MNFIDLDVAHVPADLANADWAKLARFNELLLAERVLVGGGTRFVITDGLTSQDIDDTLERIDNVMASL